MGAQYTKTRHNVGSLCLDYLVEKHRAGPYKMKVSAFFPPDQSV
jgi:peptidyl-tRNA hydrolase